MYMRSYSYEKRGENIKMHFYVQKYRICISYSSPQCFLVLQTIEMIKVQYLPIVFFMAGKLLNTAIEKNCNYFAMCKKSSEAAFSQFSCRVSSQLKICKTN